MEKENNIIKKYIEEFKNHPALIFANNAIVLNATRQGTSGYTGKENLTEWLRKKLQLLTSPSRLEDK